MHSLRWSQLMQLQNFDAADFLARHWQKKPLFIKNPWQHWQNPITAQELAGLSCEDGVEARIITEKQGGNANIWTLEHGPFNDESFAKIGQNRWTLLVQAVDQYVPQVSRLIAPFRFIPDWRIDDVMVSYAAENGGVGPHFDYYDVFLIQGAGTRKWQIGGMCDDNSPMADHDNLRQLAEFEPVEEWICEPGDILYIPPGISHNGVAIGDDCMTYSIGFRAPSRSDLISHYCDAIIDDIEDDDRYKDPDLSAQDNAGEIAANAIDAMHQMIMERVADRQAFRQWIGRYCTQPKYPDDEYRQGDITIDEVKAHISIGSVFYRHPASRFAFIRNDAGCVSLFVDGHCFECNNHNAKLAEQLCKDTQYNPQHYPQPDGAASEHETDLIFQLVLQGSLLLSAPE